METVTASERDAVPAAFTADNSNVVDASNGRVIAVPIASVDLSTRRPPGIDVIDT